MSDDKLRDLAAKKVNFRRQLVIFLIVNAFLWVIWLIECLRHHFVFPWPIYPTVIWGLVLALQAFSKFSITKKEDAIEKEYQKLKKDEKKK